MVTINASPWNEQINISIENGKNVLKHKWNMANKTPIILVSFHCNFPTFTYGTFGVEIM